MSFILSISQKYLKQTMDFDGYGSQSSPLMHKTKTRIVHYVYLFHILSEPLLKQCGDLIKKWNKRHRNKTNIVTVRMRKAKIPSYPVSEQR